MKAKNIFSTYWQQMLLLLMAIGVFCFWFSAYPHVIVMRESLQLFLWNTSYFMERMAMPGGFAQYIGEGLVQFFLNPTNGAIIYAFLFLIEQWLSALLLRRSFPSMKKGYRFLLSLVLPLALWRIAMIPEVPLTPTVALILVMGSMLLVPMGKRSRLTYTCILTPVMYWLAGPAAFLLTLGCIRWIPLTATLFAACLIGSSWVTPYPLRQIAKGIDYYWGQERNIGSYEEMDCDMMMRLGQWNGVINKFRYTDSKTVRSAVKLASFQAGQVGRQELFSSMLIPQEMQSEDPSIFSSNGLHMIINFENLTAAFMVSDIALQMALPTISQRAAFEAMEFIPNYNKSGRALKRLVETNIITGQYKTALKYISILEETTFYRQWAHEIRPMVENPQLLQKSPFFKQAQETYVQMEDMFFI